MNKPTWALCLVFLTSSCAVGPDFKRPDASAAQSYIAEGDVLPSVQKVALGRRIEAEWWTLFASAPLNSTIRQSLADNYDIAAAKETLAQAEEAVKAQSGTFWPQLSLSGQAGRQKYGVALFGPSDFMIPPFTTYQAGLGESWTLDLFGGTRRRVERQNALAEYQSNVLNAAYVTLSGNVVAQALEIASAKAEIEAAQQIIAEDEKTLKLVHLAYNAGAGTKVEILSAQSQLDNDRTLLPPLRQRLVVARHTLSILAGKAPAEWSPPDFTLDDFTLPRELPVSLPSEMVRKRPDILAAEANLHAASANIGVATASLYPTLTLNANYLLESLTPHGLFESMNRGWAVAAGLTQPLFSGGTLTAEKRQAEHAYQAALAQYKETILRAFGQVADALTALANDGDAMTSQRQAVDTARASLDLARRSYQVGNIGLLRVQDAARQLAQAQLGLVRAQRQHYIDTAQLFVVLGGSSLTAEKTWESEAVTPARRHSS